MFPGWTCVIGLWLGAVIGSFLNVVIYRMPRGLSLGQPTYSFCPNCKTRLTVPDLVPLFSWLVLRGRCRHCGAKVAYRYFIVELITGAIWAGIWWQYLVVGSDWGKALAYGLAAAALVAVIFIDWEFYIIPDQVNAFIMFVGFAYNGYLYAVHDKAASTHGIPSSVAGALLGVGILGLITLGGRIAFGKDAMGHGDIKMARGIGAVLFPVMAVISFGLAIALGAVLGILQVVVRMALDKRAAASGDSSSAEEPDRSEDLPPEPESIASIVKCVFGYLICLDVVGLFYPKLYIRWFGEDPFEPVVNLDGEQEDWEVERTMIPFGPYLALGAIVATVFEVQLRAGFDA